MNGMTVTNCRGWRILLVVICALSLASPDWAEGSKTQPADRGQPPATQGDLPRWRQFLSAGEKADRLPPDGGIVWFFNSGPPDHCTRSLGIRGERITGTGVWTTMPEDLRAVTPGEVRRLCVILLRGDAFAKIGEKPEPRGPVNPSVGLALSSGDNRVVWTDWGFTGQFRRDLDRFQADLLKPRLAEARRRGIHIATQPEEEDPIDRMWFSSDAATACSPLKNKQEKLAALETLLGWREELPGHLAHKLAKALDDESPEVRRAAAAVMVKCGPAALVYIDKMLAPFDIANKSNDDAERVAWMLYDLHWAPAKVGAALIRVMADRDADVLGSTRRSLVTRSFICDAELVIVQHRKSRYIACHWHNMPVLYKYATPNRDCS